jgi:predicted TIM-barrel fold metal-dependent hydrolase
MSEFFVVSGDSHIIEPLDLFKTRLPKHLRDRALWEEEFVLDEPLVPGGHTEFKTLHTLGYDGWTVSKYRQFGGETPDGEPENILRDMDLDGVDAAVMFPNLSLFVLFTDDHELSLAHAKVYNDYLAERFLEHKDRMRPTAAIPLTDVDDAVAEIERIAKAGLGAILVPEHPPVPYYTGEYDRVWAAAQANGTPVFIHVATGGVETKQKMASGAALVKGIMEAVNMGMNPLDDSMVANRSMGGGNTGSQSPQRIIADWVSGGACEKFPDLQFNLVEFNAGWLVSYMGSLDRAWRKGSGQDPDWWLGFWDRSRPDNDQPGMGRLFNINSKWPWPLKPSEYVQRQIHVQFADDPVAVAARHITGLSTVMWGNDYPHAEGCFRHSPQVIEENFVGVPDDDKAAILGGTLAQVAGFDTSKKFAPALI